MRKLVSITLLTLTFSAAAFAQATIPSGCPSISVAGPAVIPDGNNPVTFTATIGREPKKDNQKYVWKVDHGQIIDGQGTLSIKVIAAESTGSLTGAIDVGGLPEGCPSSASETVAWCILPEAKLLADFSIAEKLDFATAANIETQAKDEPNSQLYVLITFAQNTSKARRQKQVELIRNRLTHMHRVEPDHIIWSTISGENPQVRIYLVPPGASNPQP